VAQKMLKKLSKVSATEQTVIAGALEKEIRKSRTQKAKKIVNLSATELEAKVAGLESDLFKARMQGSVGQLANTASLWNLRKQLARVKTQLSRLTKAELLKQLQRA
jgi:ribosomal protein L29